MASIAERARVSRAARVKRRPCRDRGSGTAAKAATSGGGEQDARVVGVAAGDEPAVMVRDLTRRITAWIEVGMPDADRLHRGIKLAGRAKE